MARMAGSKAYYTFLLLNENTGKAVHDIRIELPSSTTIIKQTLAAPQLINWAYTVTRDNINGLCEVLKDRRDELFDVMSDVDMLEEYLKDNRLRPEDVRDERGEEGRHVHDHFERLARANLDSTTSDADLALASKYLANKDGWVRGVGQWWLDRRPQVEGTEKVLPCPIHGYCGTADLIWQNVVDLVPLTVTDLKTRKVDGEAYESDFFQIDSYKVAWNILHPQEPATRSTALVVRPDGSYIEEENLLPDGAFLDLMDVWLLNRELAKNRREKKRR